MSFHNPTKPVEPEKYMPDKNTQSKVIEYHAPKPETLPRPSADLPLIRIKPHVSPLLQSRTSTDLRSDEISSDSTDVQIGTMCKNGGCKEVILIYTYLIEIRV